MKKLLKLIFVVCFLITNSFIVYGADEDFIIFDTFTGDTGNVSTHSPEVPSSLSWITEGTNDYDIDTGLLKLNYASAEAQASVALTYTGENIEGTSVSMRLRFKVNPTSVPNGVNFISIRKTTCTGDAGVGDELFRLQTRASGQFGYNGGDQGNKHFEDDVFETFNITMNIAANNVDWWYENGTQIGDDLVLMNNFDAEPSPFGCFRFGETGIDSYLYAYDFIEVWNGTQADRPTPSPSDIFFDVTVVDIYDGTAITDFNATIFNGTFSETLSTDNGTVTFTPTAGNFSMKINASNYFLKQIHSVNSSVDLIVKVIQTKLILNASQIGTGTVITSFNVSVPLQSNITTNGTAILYLKAGSYTITGLTSGFIDTSKSITISALETLHENLEFGSTNFTISANDIFTNVSLSDFNVTITNEFFDSTINTDNGKVSFSLINGTYNVSIFASGYSIQTINITIDEVNQNHTFFLFLQNSIFMRLLRENDNTLIDDQTMTVDVDNEDNTFQGTFATSNGTIFLTGLPPSTYRLEPFSTEFSNRRTFFVTIQSGESIDIDMRLLNSTDSKEVTFQILDFNTDQPISGAIITATKKVNLSDITVDQAITDDTGIAQLLLKETQQYTLLITHPDFITRTVSLTPITDDTITIKLRSGVTFEFTTIFSRFTYLRLPKESIILTGNRSFNLTVSCTVSFPGCLDYFGLQFNSTQINNITASPGGGTATVAFFIDNLTTNYTFNYFVKIPSFDVFEFNFTYILREEIETGNQSIFKLFEEYDSVFPDWFKPVVAVLAALMVMIVLRRFTEISGTGLAVAGVFVEIVFAIFNWIPRLIMFVIVLIIVMGWLLKESGDT